MQKNLLRTFISLLILFALQGAFANSSHACACGCGIFDIGTGSVFPNDAGGTVFFEYNFMDQRQNWFGTQKAPGDNNDDRQIRTNIFTLGGQYLFNRSWGVQVSVPMVTRTFLKNDPTTGIVSGVNDHSIGDIRVRALYTGLAENMSTGLTFGLKLPTGDWTAAGFDRDTQIGTGSTDLLLGVYHLGSLTENGIWSWFGQLNWEQAILTHYGYMPGNETNAAAGIYYNGFTYESFKIAPVFQSLVFLHGTDTGTAANTPNSGYQRVFVSPGLETSFSKIRLYGDAEFPIYQNMNGNQLVSSVLYKLVTSFNF